MTRTPVDLSRLVPKDVCKDETIVHVLSPLGLTCGVFVWPTAQLELLRKINNSRYGNYLCWNKDNDLTKPVEAEKSTAPDGQGLCP